MIKTKENERQQSHSAFFFLPSLLFKSLQHPRSIHRLTTPRLAFSNGAVDKKKIGIRLFFAKREGKFSNLSPKLNAKEIDVSAQRGRRSLLRRSIVPRNYQQPMTGWANKIWLRQIRRAPTNGRSRQIVCFRFPRIDRWWASKRQQTSRVGRVWMVSCQMGGWVSRKLMV